MLLAAAAAAGAVLFAKRRVRWNDARTMPPPLEAAVRAYGRGDDGTGLLEVRRLLARYRAPAWEPRARVLGATHLARAGRPLEIWELLPRELPADDPLFAQASLLRARALLAKGQAAEAAEAAARYLELPGCPSRTDAAILRAAALEKDGAWSRGVELLDREPGADATIGAARMRAGHGDSSGAAARLCTFVVAEDTPPDELARALDALVALAPDPEARFDASARPKLAARARTLVEAGRADLAIALLRAARASAAPSSAAPPAEALVEAEALVKLQRPRDAAPLIARAREGDPGSRDGAAYLAARVAAAEGRTAAYHGGLEALARSGAPPWRLAALLDLARIADGIPSGPALAAYQRYRAAAGADADPLGLLREAWIAFELGRAKEADAAFARCLARKDAPDGVRAAAVYWSARRSELAGHAAAARESYRALAAELPNHYYGQLASKRAGLSAPAPPSEATPVADPGVLGSAGRWLLAARALSSVGLSDEAAACYRAAISGSRAEAAPLAAEAARAALAANAPSEALAVAQAAAGDRIHTPVASLPRALWRLLYPAPGGEALVKYARASGLDPDLVAAVALQESAYNPLAVSSAGARGILQLMPDVAAELAKAAGMATFKPDDLFDPDVNLRLGCAHLKDYIARTGSVPRALAAYNGGPSRVERWTLPHDDDERFVERIPIPETRLYVKRVLAGERMYALVWPNGPGRE